MGEVQRMQSNFWENTYQNALDLQAPLQLRKTV